MSATVERKNQSYEIFGRVVEHGLSLSAFFK